MAGNDSLVYQGRQYHMWFGHGTKPKDASAHDPDAEDVPSLPDRIRGLTYTLIAGLPASLRRHPIARLDAADRDRLERVMTGVVHAVAIGPHLAASRVLNKSPDAPGIVAFIEAGEVLRNAQSYADLRTATDLVARSAQQMGLDRFRPFLHETDEHIDNTGGLLTLARDFTPTAPSPPITPGVRTPLAPVPPSLPPGNLARLLGALFRKVGWVVLATWVLNRIGQANREADLQAAIERFGLDRANPADMAAAAAYVQARANRSLLLGTDLPASAQDVAAEQIMRAVQADPSLWERAMAGAADALATVRAEIRKTPNPTPDPVPKLGFGYEIRSDDERDLVHDLMAQGKNGAEIAAALEEFRTRRTPTALERRNTPGTATASKPLKPADEDWLRKALRMPDGVPVPAQVAERLRGRRFETFDDFREAFWKEVEATPELTRQISAANRTRMRNGSAPFAPRSERASGARSWHLHHEPPISKGGPVHDMSNLRVVTPRQHRDIHRGGGQ